MTASSMSMSVRFPHAVAFATVVMSQLGSEYACWPRSRWQPCRVVPCRPSWQVDNLFCEGQSSTTCLSLCSWILSANSASPAPIGRPAFRQISFRAPDFVMCMLNFCLTSFIIPEDSVILDNCRIHTAHNMFEHMQTLTQVFQLS